MNLDLDGSASVKLYVAEPGQPELIQQVSEAEMLVSHLIAYVEVHAAFAKRLRMEDLTIVSSRDSEPKRKAAYTTCSQE